MLLCTLGINICLHVTRVSVCSDTCICLHVTRAFILYSVAVYSLDGSDHQLVPTYTLALVLMHVFFFGLVLKSVIMPGTCCSYLFVIMEGDIHFQRMKILETFEY